MATKNISRTIIEGGRAKRNQEDRYLSNTKHRAQSREFSNEVKNLVDPDEARVAPKRQKVRKDFDDKLSAAYRWLRSQCGRAWNTVLSELTTRFDTRTTAGRHIVYDHLLGDVCTNQTDRKLFEEFNWFDFIVDAKGILQLNDRNRWSKRRGRIGNKWPTQKEIEKWTQGRRVMDYGTSLYWMKPQATAWKPCDGYRFFDRCNKHHRPGKTYVLVAPTSVLAFEKPHLHKEKNEDGTYRYYREKATRECLQPVGRFMQDARLTAADIVMWKKIHQNDRDRLLWLLPKESRTGKNQWRKRL